MNPILIKQLIFKDWSLYKHLAIIYLFVGIASLLLLTSVDSNAVNLGAVLFVSTIAGGGMHLLMNTVLNEKKQKTLFFIMSLPINHMEFTIAKFLTNVLFFLGLWLFMFAGITWSLQQNPNLPMGYLPILTIVLFELFIAYLLTLVIAMLTQHEGLTIFTSTLGTMFFSVFVLRLLRLPSINEYLHADLPVWNQSVINIITIEFLLLLAIPIGFIIIQIRKKSFM